MALEIIINGVSIDLPINFSLDNEYRDSAFEDGGDFIPGSFSYTFTLPTTNKNIITFDHASFIEVKKVGRIYECEVRMHTKPLHYGKLRIRRINNKRLEGNLLINGFQIEVLDKNLADMVTGSVNIGNTTSQVQLFVGDSHSNEYYGHSVTVDGKPLMFQFPLAYMPNFYGSIPEWENYCKFINYFRQSTGFTPENKTTTENLGAPNQFNIVPWLYMKYVLERIFEYAGYTVGGSFYNADFLKRLLIPSNYALDKKDGRTFYFKGFCPHLTYSIATTTTTGAPIFDDILSFPSSIHNISFDELHDDFNAFDDTISRYNILVSDEYSCTYNLFIDVPGATDTGVPVGIWIILRNTDTGDMVNVLFDNTYRSTDFVGGPIQFTRSFDFDALAADGYKLQILMLRTDEDMPEDFEVYGWWEIKAKNNANINIYSGDVVFANHVPDMKVSDFFASLKKTWNIKPDFDLNNKHVELNFTSDRLTNKRGEDITAIASADYDIEETEYKPRNFMFDFSKEPQADKIKQLDASWSIIGAFNYKSDLPTPTASDNIAFTRDAYKVWKSYTDDSGITYQWELFGEWYYDTKNNTVKLTDDRGYQDWKIPITPPFMEYKKPNDESPIDIFNGSLTYLIPSFTEQGNSKEYLPGTITDFGPRLVFWCGLTAGESGNYPLATPGRLGMVSSTANTTAYHINNTEICIITYWVRWEIFEVNTRLVTRYVKLNINQLNDAMFKGIMRIDNNEYIVKKVNISLVHDGPKPALMELLMLRGG